MTTGSAPGVTIEGDSLATWNEAPIPLRHTNDEQNTNAVWLGWNNRMAGADTAARGTPASYTISLSDSLVRALRVGDTSSVMLSLAPTRDAPPPRRATHDSGAKDKRAPKPPAVHDDSVPMDLTVELVDADGHRARLPLSLFAPVRRPLETHVLRRADREASAFRHPYELVLQTYPMPLAAFRKVAPAFEPTRLRAIRLVFDRTPSGTVVMDDVGLANPDPAFLVPGR